MLGCISLVMLECTYANVLAAIHVHHDPPSSLRIKQMKFNVFIQMEPVITRKEKMHRN
jgi:hypothetical protein